MATQPGTEADSIDTTPILNLTTNLIFVRTNLDTTTAVRVSLTDTLSDIKDKFLLAHMKVNPGFGEIRIHYWMAKRRGFLYRLPDDLSVIDVFKQSKRDWCLTADCIKVSTCDSMQISYDPSSSEGLKTDVTNDRLLSSPDIASRKKAGTSSKVEVGADLKREGFSAGDTEICAGRKRKRRHKENVCKDNGGVNLESVVPYNSVAGKKLQNDGTMQEVKSEGKKRKKSKKKGAKIQDMPHDGAVNTVEKEAAGRLSLNHADVAMLSSQSKPRDCIEKELIKKPTSSLPDPSEAHNVSEHKKSGGTGKRKKKKQMRGKKPSDDIEKIPTGTENEVNISISQTDHILEYDGINKENMGNVTDFPVDILGSNQTDKNKKDVGDEGEKTKKKRKGSEVPESDVQENFPIKGSSITSSETDEKLPTGNENEANFLISQTEQRLECANKENVGNDANFPVVEKENEIRESNQEDKNKTDVGNKGKKSKKKRKKSQLTESDVQENFPIKASSITSSEANEKLPTGNENEANIVISQTEQALEYDGTNKENMGNDADFPVLKKGNEILEFIKVKADKVNEDEGVTGRKCEKKKKKRQVSESEVQANSPIKGAHITTSSGENEKISTVNENESNFVISQTEQTLDDCGTKKKNKVSDADCPVLEEKEILGLPDKNNKGKSDDDKKSKNKRKKSQVTVSDVQENKSINKTISSETKDNLAINSAHIVSSQVVPDKNGKHLKTVNGTAVVTDDHEIDFRLHFVHDKDQQKVASGDNVKVVSQSNDEMETRRNIKKDVLPSISAISDLHNSLSSSDKQDSENKSSLKEGASGMRSGDSKLNSQNLVKGSKQMVAASSHSGDKNTSLVESSMEKSETLPSNKQVKKRHLVLDANTKMGMKTPHEKRSLIKPQAPCQDRSKKSITDKMMLMKTSEKNLFTKPVSIFQGKNSIINKMMLVKPPEKKNLFTKSGSIFQDNSAEDYMGDNGRIVTSDASTDDSSDSSSESGDSEGESEMSHNFGSDDGKGISYSRMLEMRTILRSSERFKKAKLIASQSEPEPDELLSMEAAN